MKLTIFKRLVIGNLIMIGFLIFVGAYAIYKLDTLGRLSRDIIDTDTQSLNLCENLSMSLLSLIKLKKKYIECHPVYKCGPHLFVLVIIIRIG